MMRQQMNYLLLTFRIKAKEDSKVTAIHVARKAIRRQNAGPSQIMVKRLILKEAEKKKHCNNCHRDSHTEAECFREPGNPGYKEFTPKG